MAKNQQTVNMDIQLFQSEISLNQYLLKKTL